MQPNNSTPNPVPIDTSIVVATCSRAGLLRGALESLMAQQSDASRPIEIIVVDDGSTDETPALLVELQRSSPVPFTVLQGVSEGVAAARNLGGAHARGAWLASFDDDQIALPDWLRRLRELADASGAACIGGALALQVPAGVAGDAFGPRARRVLGEHLHGDAAMRYPAGILPATNNVLLRRDVFAALGGYDASFTEGGEDKDFFDRVSATGHELWFQPRARALHVLAAQRFSRGNLRWTSMRLGASDARVAQRKRRFIAPLRLAAIRVAIALLRDLPQLAAVKLGRSMKAQRAALDAACSLWYSEGVWRALPAVFFPRRVRSRFLASMNFRTRNGERLE